ncbi:hypothetical protein [Pseudomonas graminis]|uniref:Uncharacterized protein n=1 Tax=Pseudomonas graminis TaxID=158627 RepID=A0A1C2DY41_9PSED|nr:hypothetical protein [Pseudomonas graminis]OCX19595.1 hypothetical protein BBI10_14480 [Pseudomonas graminis]
MHEVSAWFFAQLSVITTITGVVAFFVSCVVKRNSDNTLMDAVTRSATWSALPNGVAFLLCTTDSSFIPKLADSSVAFFMGGIALLAVGMWDLKNLFKREAPPDPASTGAT